MCLGRILSDPPAILWLVKVDSINNQSGDLQMPVSESFTQKDLLLSPDGSLVLQHNALIVHQAGRLSDPAPDQSGCPLNSLRQGRWVLDNKQRSFNAIVGSHHVECLEGIILGKNGNNDL